MPPTRAFYSIVQYVPDAGRGEAANAGVLLFVPSRRWIEVRVSPSLDRVRKFFRPGRRELERVAHSLSALESRMGIAREEFETESDLAEFVARRADDLRLTAPRLVMVEEPEADLDALYGALVGDQAMAMACKESGPALPAEVARVFDKLVAQKRAWRPGTIRLPTVGENFEVPFAYENGRVNYVRPESLAPGANARGQLRRLGFNGQLIYSHPIQNKLSKLIVLSADPSATPELETQYESALSDFHVQFVPHRQVQEFAAAVEQSAH